MNQQPPVPNTQPTPIPPTPGVQPGSTPQMVQTNFGTTPPSQEGGMSFGTILKIIAGIVLVFVLGFILYQFVFIPFSGNIAGGKVTLTYWGLWEDNAVMQSTITDFESQHPEIAIQYIKQDPTDYSQRLITRIPNGTGPDIFRYHATWLPMLTADLLPLPSSVITKDVLAKSYFPVVSQDMVKNGAIYGIPLDMDALALYTNNDLLQKAGLPIPTTWESFSSEAKAMTVKGSDGKIQTAGAALGTFDNIAHAPDIISLLLTQNGVDLKTMQPQANASDALTFYTSFARGDENSVWNNTLDNSELAFSHGQLAMYIGYSWDIFKIRSISATLPFTVSPVPHLPGRNNTIASYWVEGVSSKSVHAKEALLFMKFLAQKDTLEKLYTAETKTRAFGELYPRSDMTDLLKSNALIYPFVEQSSNSVSSFFAGETFDKGINGQMNKYLSTAVQSILTSTSSDTAVVTLAQGVSQVLQQYGQR